MKTLLLPALALLAPFCAFAADAPAPEAPKAAATAAPKIGEPAPALGVADLDGKVRTLEEFRGKIVVLEWFNPGCPFVKKFYGPGKMQAWQTQLAAKDVVWLTVASTRAGHPDHKDAATLKTWLKDNRAAPATVLIDTDGALARRYAAKTTPHLFVIGKDGKLAYMGAIDSIRSPKPADIDKATPYLLNAVEAVAAGKPADPAETKAYGCGVKL